MDEISRGLVWDFRYGVNKQKMDLVIKQLKKYNHQVVVCECGMRVARYYVQYHLTHRKHELGMKCKQQDYENQCKMRLLNILATYK
jgi:hypothetical protein